MASLTAARVAFSKMCDALGSEYLSEHVDFQINTHCTVVQPRSDECDFLEICAVLTDVFDIDKTVGPDPKTGVLKGFIDGHLVLVMPIGQRRRLVSVVPTFTGDAL
jgi:hypothetical protein